MPESPLEYLRDGSGGSIVIDESNEGTGAFVPRRHLGSRLDVVSRRHQYSSIH